MPFAAASDDLHRLGFAVPDWLGVGERGPDGPTILLADSAGVNMRGLFAACRLALDDAGFAATIMVGDDARDAGEAAEVAEAACRAGIDCCVGHFGTTTALPASRIYGGRQVLYLAPGTSSDALCGPDAPTTLRFFGRDSEQSACLAAAAAAFGPPMVILGQPNNYGARLAGTLAGALARFEPELRNNRGQKLANLPIKYASTLRTVILCGSSEFNAECYNHLRLIAASAAFLLSDDSAGADMTRLPGGAERLSVCYLEEPSNRLIDRDAGAVRDRAAQLLGSSPGAYFYTSYTAVRAFVSAWQHAGSSRAAWRPYLLGKRWQTPYGLLRLSPAGELTGHRWTMRPMT